MRVSSIDINLVRELFLEVQGLSPDERARTLNTKCAGNPRLRTEVESILDFSEESPEPVAFIETAAIPGGLSSILAEVGAEQAELPESIGSYRIVRVLGEGGMGTVYEARQRHPDRRVALKILRRGMASDGVLKRFEQESQLLGRLQHVGIAQVYESGTYGPADRPSRTQPFFAMEFVEGVPISDLARKTGCTSREIVSIVALVADAVEHAHLRGVLHRDLKPANILVTPDGQPKVLDFGVARALGLEVEMTSMRTDVGELIGTLAYMSPEQITGSAGNAGIDQRSDVYSLGVVLYELLTGRLPHDVRGSSIAHAAQRIMSEDPPPMSSLDRELRGDIETIVRKALERETGRRYQSAAAFGADLRRYLRNEPIAARPATAMYQIRKFAQRNRALVAGAGFAVVALATGAAVSTILAINESRLRHEADLSKSAAETSDAAARRSEAASRRSTYRLALAAADAVSHSDPVKALAHLDSAPTEFRGWEWNYLRTRLSTTGISVASDRADDECAGAVTPAGLPVAAVIRAGDLQVVDLTTHHIVTNHPGTDGRFTDPQLSDDGAVIAAMKERPDVGRAGAEHPPSNAPRSDKERVCPVVVFDTDGRERWRTPVDCTAYRLSPDGRVMAVESADRHVRLYRIGDPAPILEIPEADAGSEKWQPRALFAFRRGSAQIRVSFAQSVEVLVFDTQTGRPIEHPLPDYSSTAIVDIGEDRVAMGEQRRIEIRDHTGLHVLQTLQGHMAFVRALAPSPDLTRLASASSDGTIRIWDLATGACDAVIAIESMGNSLRWLHDGKCVLTTDDDGRVKVVSVAPESDLVLRGHHSYVYHALFSPDSRYIVSAGWKDEVKVWESDAGRLIATLTENEQALWDPPSIVGFRRDTSELFVQAWYNTTRQWNLDAIASGDTTARLTTKTANSIFALAGLDWNARRVRTDGGQCSAASADGTLIADNDGSDVRITTPQGELLRTLHLSVKGNRAVAFSPDGATLAVAGDDAKVYLLDPLTGEIQRTLVGHRAAVYTLAFSPDGSRLASGGNDNVIIIWDPKFGDSLLELRGHAAYVHAVSFSPDGASLVSASGDGTVRVWRASTH